MKFLPKKDFLKSFKNIVRRITTEIISDNVHIMSIFAYSLKTGQKPFLLRAIKAYFFCITLGSPVRNQILIATMLFLNISTDEVDIINGVSIIFMTVSCYTMTSFCSIGRILSIFVLIRPSICLNPC